MTNLTWFTDFANPPAIFRPLPLWSWNERIEEKEVRRQVDLIADAGWGGGFIHSRKGLITKYLDEDWFAAVSAVIDQSQKRGLKVCLYDEDKYPSGFCGGSVPLASETFRNKVLFARPIGREVPTDAIAIGRPSNGIQVYVWTARLGCSDFNGTSYVDLMYNSAVREFIADAYETYADRFLSSMGETIVCEFTDEPHNFLWSYVPYGSVPFSTDLIKQFVGTYGYDPQNYLFYLFVDAPGAERFRLHYYRTVNTLFEHYYSRQIGDWCEAHTIAFTGHYLNEHGVLAQQKAGLRIMPNYRHQTWPGIDHLGRQTSEFFAAKQCHSVVNQYGKQRMLTELYGAAGGSLNFEDRFWIGSQQIALGANLLCHHVALYTMAGCRKRDFPQNMFYQQPWWPLNNLVDEQLSRTCVAMAQGRYVAEALILHPQESSFVIWRPSCKVPDTKKIARIDSCNVAKDVENQLARIDYTFQSIMEVLLSNQRTFDLGDETILHDEGRIDASGGRPVLRVGQMLYPVVIMPSMITISKSTLSLLQDFQRAGGILGRCGNAPMLLEGESSDELVRWVKDVPEVQLDDLPMFLKQRHPPNVELMDTDSDARQKVLVHLRDLPDGSRLIYLTNLNRFRGITSVVRCAGSWKDAQLLESSSGAVRRVKEVKILNDAVELPLTLAPSQALLLRVSKDRCCQEQAPVSLQAPEIKKTVDLPATSWTVERLDDNAMTLDYAQWCESDGIWSAKAMPVVVIQERLNQIKYNGPLTLRYHFRVGNLGKKCHVMLVVEYPERYQIKINGVSVSYKGLPFWRDFRWLPIDITGMLVDGQNTVELHCEKFAHGDLTNIDDVCARYGTEIEAIYLVGDFAVRGELTEEKPESALWKIWNLPPACPRCFAGESFVLDKPCSMSFGDTTLQGLPFYAGRIRLETELPEIRLEPAQRLLFQIDNLDGAVAEVALDGHVVGHIFAHPLHVELPNSVANGRRKLSLTLHGTLRNLLGPHHHPDGDMANVYPEFFLPSVVDPEDWPSFLDDWTQGRIAPKDWRDRYCMVSFGNIKSARVLVVHCTS